MEKNKQKNWATIEYAFTFSIDIRQQVDFTFYTTLRYFDTFTCAYFRMHVFVFFRILKSFLYLLLYYFMSSVSSALLCKPKKNKFSHQKYFVRLANLCINSRILFTPFITDTQYFFYSMSMLPRLKLLEETISPQHRAVFNSLVEANEKLGINAILRVAGGWVRDTLLGLQSNDIDIAIETPAGAPVVSGEFFARALARYQADQSLSAERTVSVIRVNPALSKHIETATVCVHNIPVEFCSLRTDTYTDTSRIPSTSPGTPLEDALRRDFTINALFYNLHSQYIEDFTSGLTDLDSRIIRTPLNPRETFSDDPLRLLRGIRFVGQLGNYNFHLEDTIFSAVDDSLLNRLLEKVSRERIGKEFSKMVSSPNPEKCLEILFRMRILQKILLVEVHVPPSKKKGSLTEAAVSPAMYPLRTLVDETSVEFAHHEYLAMVIRHVVPLFSDEEKCFVFRNDVQLVPILFTLTVIFYRGMTSEEVEKSLLAVCLNGLKLSRVEFQGVRRMVESFNKLYISQLTKNEFPPDASGPLSLTAKQKLFDAWSPLTDLSVPPDAFKVVLCMYAALGWEHTVHFSEGSTEFSSLPLGSLANVRCTAQSMWNSLSSFLPSLLEAFSLPLPLDGKDVRQLIPIIPKEIGTVLMALRVERAMNPKTVDTPERAAAWVRDWYSKNGAQTE